MPCEVTQVVQKVYHPREHDSSPFFKVITSHFEAFERLYPERFQGKYGFWRPVIRSSLDKFLKCGDLKEGFARIRCPDCGEEFFVAYSCRQRSCCPSCDQKRALLLGIRLAEVILAPIPHRQWVFTIPKRLRIYFRFDRSLLGKLCRSAYETVREALAAETGDDIVSPGMIATVQTFGDLIHWNAHIHALVSEGGFTENGHFVRVPEMDKAYYLSLWQDKVFDLLMREEKISEDVVRDMRTWKHSGFSIDCSVKIAAGDSESIKRLAQYIGRCPFSLARIISIDQDEIIERILKHCGLWKDPLRSRESEARSQPRPPPEICVKFPALEEPLPDYLC